MRKGRKLPDHQSKHHELNRAENSESTALKKERPFWKKEKKKKQLQTLKIRQNINYNLCGGKGPLHVLWQVSLGCWVTWSIPSWQQYYKSVLFPKDEWWVAELVFLSLNNWGLNFLQNESSDLLLTRKTEKKVYF